jgi:hypothetical protein
MTEVAAPAGSPATMEAAQLIRAATSAPAAQYPRVLARRAAATATSVAAGTSAPSRPALTAAAAAAAPASASPVLWVTMLASSTRSTRTPRSSAGVVMPAGVMRIAAPLLVPSLPASVTLAPAASALTARLVDGPSRSSDPRARMEASQAISRRASSAGSARPSRSISSRASSTACSVSSVTEPAAFPAASG